MLVKLAFVTLGMWAAMDPAFAQGLTSTVPGRGPGTVVLDFDDVLGQPPPFTEGTPVQPSVMIDKQYLRLGVAFDAPGGGIFVAASPSNSISAPNAAGATSPGPLISYSDTVTASFWMGNNPATVGYFSVRMTGSTTISLYDLNGRRFATATGGAGSSVVYQGSGLHSVHIDLGPLAFFDDFTFDELQAGSGFVLSPPLPGSAGATNVLHVTGGTPGERVLVVIGIDAGSPVALLSTARILRVAPIDTDGRATVSFDIPADCAGMRLTARALSDSGDSTQTVRDYLAPAPVGR